MTAPTPNIRLSKQAGRKPRRQPEPMKSVAELRADLDAMYRGLPDWPVRFEAAKNLTLMIMFGGIRRH